MRKNSNNVSEKNRTIGMLAIAAFLMLFASTLGVGWVSLGAVAGTSDIDWMGDTSPEPTGDPGSGWIPDQIVDMAGVETWNPQIATGPGGEVHVVYQVQASIGGWQIVHQQSSDGGLTWTGPSGVAASPDDEKNPDIAIHPDDGRIFVVYERWTGLASNVYISYSDDGSTWTNVLIFNWGFPELDPSVVVDFDTGSPNYYVWVAFTYQFDPDNSNVMVYRSDDRGATWAQQHFLGAVPDDDVYDDPELAFQHGSDGVDRLLLVCRNGVDLVDTNTIHLDWSDDMGVTWSSFVVQTETDIVDYPTIAASRGRDSFMVAWQLNAADIQIRYRGNTDSTAPGGASWSGTGIRFPTGSNSIADRAPRLAVDGDGTMFNNLPGNYHLIWTVGGLDRDVMYTMRATDLVMGWSTAIQVSDTAGMASPGVPSKGITTQLRGSSWYPAVVWSDFRSAPPNDIAYTTPGSRVIVDTNPPLLNVDVDFLTYAAPANFIWPAGWSHNLNVLSPQTGGPGIQYVWSDWSDLGAQSHFVVADTIDTTYTANFITQFEVTIDAWDQTNLVQLLNVPVYIDGPQVGITPHVEWLDDGVSYNIGVQDPYNDGSNDFNFADWDIGPIANPVMYTPIAPATITANYNQAPSSTFSLEIDPLTTTIKPGDAPTYTITLKSLSGYAGDVDLSATALPGTLLPPGGTASATFLPNPATVPLDGQVTSTLTIDNTATVPDDIYTITVLGEDTVSVAISDSNDTELIVATQTFDVTALPLTQPISPGQDAQYTVTVSSVNLYAGSVDLTAAALPAGLLPPATATFVPSTVVVPAGGSDTSTLTISNTGTVAEATYTITITGEDPVDTDTVDVDLVVTTIPFFTIDATPPLVSVSPGGIATYTVTVTSVNTFAGNVDVSVAHTLTAADASMSWDKIALVIPDGGSDLAVLTVDTTAAIALMDFDLDFYADDGALNVTDQSTLNITAVVTGSISGTVLDQDGDQVDDAMVELLEGTNLVASTSTNNDGDYSFANVDAGSYTVKATKTGYDEDTITVTVSAADPDQTDKDLILELTTYKIEGDVKDEDTGEGIGGATVKILDENGDEVGSDITSGSGHFSVGDLPPGDYTIVITADDYKELTLEDEIVDQDLDLRDVDITPEAAAGNFLADYWWLLLLIIIIVVVLILVVMLAKRKKPQPEEAPPMYATAQVPEGQAPPYQEAPAEQPPYEAPPEQYPQEPQPETYPEETPPETPPEGYPPEE